MTDQYAVIGWPIAHSLSPAMHNAAFQALGIDATYSKLAIEPNDLARALKQLRSDGIAGFNVTVPHKETIMPLLDAIEPAARAIGAVNTVVRDSERWIGCNTDAPGLAASLREANVTLAGAHVTIIGAGGAARAAIVGLGQAGAASITIAARRVDRAQALADELRDASGTSTTGIDMGEELRDALAKTTLLVQATSATLAGHDSQTSAQTFADSVPIEAMPSDATVIDLVYRPRVTTLMQRAQARELKIVDGLGMLLHQGAIAWTGWTGRDAPIDVMRQALQSQL